MADVEAIHTSASKRRWRPRTLALVAVLLGGAGLGGAVVALRWQSGSGQRLAAAAQRAAEAGQHEEAFRLFAAASAAQGERRDLTRATMVAALAAGRLADAAQRARQAWELGDRDEVVLDVLIAADPALAADEEGLARAEILLSELADPAARLRLRARLLARRGRWAEVVPVLQQLRDLDPALTVSSALAEAHLQLDQAAEAVAELAPRQDDLDARSVRLLAFAHLRLAEAPTMAQTWTTIAELFAAAEARGLDDDGLWRDAALHAVIRFDLVGADAALARIGATGPHALEARLLRWWLAGLRDGATAMPMIEGLSGAGAEGLRLLGEAAGGNDADTFAFTVQKVARLIGTTPGLDLLAGERLRQLGRPREAAAHYATITGLLGQAPLVRIAHAEALLAAGDRQAAAALLADLHARIGVTKRSLLLLAELTGGSWSASDREQVRRVVAEQARDAELADLAGRIAQRQWAAWLAGDGAADRVELAAVGDALHQGGDEVFAAIGRLKVAEEPRAVLRGMALQARGRHREALDAFAVARGTGGPSGLATAEALSAVALGDRTSALAAVRRALEEDRSDLIAWHLRVDLVASAAEAEAILADLATAPLRPIDAEALRALAHWRGGDLAAAARVANAVVAGESGHPIALPIAVDGLLAAGRFVEAIALLGDPLLHGRDDLRLRRLSAHLALGQTAAAMTDLDACQPATQRILESDGLRVALALAGGDTAAAARAVDRLPIETPPARRAIWVARVQEASGRAAAAAVTLVPHLADVAAASTWLTVVLRHDLSGDPADRLLAQPRPPEQLRQLAAVAGDLEHWAVAAAIAEAAHRAAPEDPACLNDWAWWGSRAGRLTAAQALPLVEAALVTLPQNPDLLDTLARLALEAQQPQVVLARFADRAAVVAAHGELQILQIRALRATGAVEAATQVAQEVLARADAAPRWPLRTPRDEIIALATP